MIIRKKYKLIICILWLFCSVALNGCRDRQSEMLLAGQTETENTRTPEVTEAVDVEITKTAEVEKQTEPVESQPETVEPPAKIFVDVCGAVANPGVYEMEAGNYPMPEESTSTLGSPGDDTDENASDTVNINTADAAALKTLTGIGEAKARAILSYREEHGAFSTVEEIMQVPGIKESTFLAIKDKIAVK